MFIGYPVDSALERVLRGANAFQKHLLNGGEYLQSVEIEKRQYIGKRGSFLKVEEVIDFQKHVASLCRTVAPQYSFSENQFVILPL